MQVGFASQHSEAWHAPVEHDIVSGDDFKWLVPVVHPEKAVHVGFILHDVLCELTYCPAAQIEHFVCCLQ